MKDFLLNVLIGLIKLTSAITLIVFSSRAVSGADDIESGDHACTGTTATLVKSLKGDSGEGTLAGVAAGLVLLDLVFHGVNTSLGQNFSYWSLLDKLQHGLEFAILGLSASVLHTLDLSDNGGALQSQFVAAGCGDDYKAVLKDGLLLVGVSFLATLVQFLILRVKFLSPFGLQEHFDHITGDNCR